MHARYQFSAGIVPSMLFSSIHVPRRRIYTAGALDHTTPLHHYVTDRAVVGAGHLYAISSSS